MHVEEALKARISVRDFLSTPVEQSSVKDILDIARWSPSGGNLQPWKVIVVSGEARNRVCQAAQAVLAKTPYPDEDQEFPVYPSPLWEPYRSRRFKLGEDMYALLGIPRDDKAGRLRRFAANFNFFGAPVGLFFVIDRGLGHGQWAHLGMFMQSIALTATAKGLGTCMQESWGMLRDTLHRHLILDKNEVVYCGMALGHPNPHSEVNRLRSERAEVDEFAQFRGFEASS